MLLYKDATKVVSTLNIDAKMVFASRKVKAIFNENKLQDNKKVVNIRYFSESTIRNFIKINRIGCMPKGKPDKESSRIPITKEQNKETRLLNKYINSTGNDVTI